MPKRSAPKRNDDTRTPRMNDEEKRTLYRTALSLYAMMTMIVMIVIVSSDNERPVRAATPIALAS
jgi:hypothetical protein